MRLLILISFSLFRFNCSGNHVMQARQTGKLFDRYFVLKEKRYTYYSRLIFNLPHLGGRYAISNDTIYLLTKHKRLYYMDGYGVVNSDSSSVVVYGLDSSGSQEFRIMYYHR